MNKKIFKFFKKTFAFILVLVINFNTYAAVGGNDGSAFVTKAEFDAIVNTFNEQMDNYESSLVSKIDGAIANYLTSLSDEVTMTLDDLSSRVKRAGNEYVTFYNYPTQSFDVSNDTLNGQAGSYYFYASRYNTAGVYMRISSKNVVTGNVFDSLMSFGSKNCFYMINDTDIIDTGSGYEDKAIFLSSKKSYSNNITLYNSGSWSSISPWEGSLDATELWNASTQNHTVDVKNNNGFSGTYSGSEVPKMSGKDMTCFADISSSWTEASSTKFAGTGYSSCGIIQSATLKGIKYSDRGLFNGTQQTVSNCYGPNAGGRMYTYVDSTTQGQAFSPQGGQTWVYKFYWHKIYTSN